MDMVDWAANAAQINADIRLANEHLPPEMQVRQRDLNIALVCCFVSAGTAAESAACMHFSARQA